LSRLQHALAATTGFAGAACWNSTGVRGDSSCAKLEQHIHCRNCPVYSAAAVSLLDAEPPPDYLAHWTRQAAQPAGRAEIETLSVVVFRIGAEWLALPTPVLKEIVSLRTIHSLPHRRGGTTLGLVNIRGELLVCFSLQELLGLQVVGAPPEDRRRVLAARFLVLEAEGKRAVCAVDEVHGIARFHAGEVTPVPATIAKASVAYTRSVLAWQKQSVGLLDEQLLLHTVNRNLA
jgi:chemotaxis-related protein WspD